MSKKYDLNVKEALITSPGDPSVGLFSQDWRVTKIDFDPSIYGSEDEAREVLEEFRSRLQDAFEVLDGNYVYVQFDTELALEGSIEEV